MQNRIKGKWTFITGATAGIGKAIAKIFADSGSNLVINGRRKNRLEELKQELEKHNNIEVALASFDVRDRKSVV